MATSSSGRSGCGARASRGRVVRPARDGPRRCRRTVRFGDVQTAGNQSHVPVIGQSRSGLKDFGISRGPRAVVGRAWRGRVTPSGRRWQGLRCGAADQVIGAHPQFGPSAARLRPTNEWVRAPRPGDGIPPRPCRPCRRRRSPAPPARPPLVAPQRTRGTRRRTCGAAAHSAGASPESTRNGRYLQHKRNQSTGTDFVTGADDRRQPPPRGRGIASPRPAVIDRRLILRSCATQSIPSQNLSIAETQRIHLLLQSGAIR